MRVLVFAPQRTPEDAALKNSRLVADWVVAMLSRRGVAVDALFDHAATGEALSATLSLDSHAALTAFGHGDQWSIKDARGGDAVHRENLHLLTGRVVYAFACQTGDELARHAMEAGARCYAGYRTSVIVQWDLRSLHADIHPSLIALATHAAGRVLEGVWDLSQLQRELSDLADVLTLKLQAHDQDDMGLYGFMTGLVDNLVVLSAAADPSPAPAPG